MWPVTELRIIIIVTILPSFVMDVCMYIKYKIHKCKYSVMVNFSCHLDWARCTQILSQILLWVVLWGHLGMRLTFKLVDWVKQIALLKGEWASSSQGRPELNNMPDPPLSRRGFFLSDCLWIAVWGIFLPLGFNWNISSNWVLSLSNFGWGLYHWLSWTSGLPSRIGIKPSSLQVSSLPQPSTHFGACLPL